MPGKNQPPPVSPLSAVESYGILRDQLQHEDNLITQRLSWLTGSQAFLFTAYAIVLNAPERPKNALVGSLQDILLEILPAIGFLSAALIYVSVIAGVLAMINIYRFVHSRSDIGDIDRFLPRRGRMLTRSLGFASPILLPALFLFVWKLLWSHSLPNILLD